MQRTATEIRHLITARAGILWLQTPEERRAEALVRSVANTFRGTTQQGKSADFGIFFWRVSRGLWRVGDEGNPNAQLADPQALFGAIAETPGRSLYVLEDLSPWLKTDLALVRKLRDEIEAESALPAADMRALVVIDTEPAPDIPGVVPVEMPLPSRDELGRRVDGIMEQVNGEIRKAAEPVREEIVDALTGLQMEQADVACSRSIAECRRIDPARLVQTKKNLISSDGALTWIDPDPRGFDGIGGLERLKSWLQSRRQAFGSEAREWGLPRPRALLASGLPGVGKSLCAKCVSSAWQMPLLRFDVASAFGKFVGESEKNLRKALQTAGAVAPCILWIDEIEKAFAGSGGSGEGDAGTTLRVFGQFLTWLQENESPVFLIATANDPEKLPAEFFRAGRFDAIFWCDMPGIMAREKIVDVLKVKHPRCAPVDAPRLAANTDQYTCSEIEQAMIQAMYSVFEAGGEAVGTDDVLAALPHVNQVIRGWREKLQRVRDWAKGAALPADDVEIGESEDRIVSARFAAQEGV